MYVIKSNYCQILLDHSNRNNNVYPKRKVIEKYKRRDRKAQENTVRALAAHLNVSNWRDLVI